MLETLNQPKIEIQAESTEQSTKNPLSLDFFQFADSSNQNSTPIDLADFVNFQNEKTSQKNDVDFFSEFQSQQTPTEVVKNDISQSAVGFDGFFLDSPAT